MAKVKKIPAYTSTRTIHLVWFVTMFGCLTGIIMAALVWWTIGSIRDVREANFLVKGKVNTVLSSFGQSLAEHKLYFHQILKDEKDTTAANHLFLSDETYLRKKVELFESIAGETDLGDNFLNVKEEVRSFLALGAECENWQNRFKTNAQNLSQSRKNVLFSLRKIHEEIDRAYGRRRLAKALTVRKFESNASYESSLVFAKNIIQSEKSNDLTILLREVSDLALLVERIRGETHPDFLADIKDNRLRTLLVRLRRSALLLPDSSEFNKRLVPMLLDELENTLFGKGYVMDSKHQSVNLGLEGYYNEAVKRLSLADERDRLRREIDDRSDRLTAALQSVRDLVEVRIDREGRGVENTLEKTGLSILLIILFTGTIFVFASSRIIRAIRKQVRAIEDANLVLDARTKALLNSQQELNDSKLRLQYLSSNLLNAQEGERKRIARELHDELGASMAFLKMQVRSVEKSLGSQMPEELHEECDKLRASINQIIENVRRLSRDLSPVVLDDLGLEAAIEYLVENFSELNEIEIKAEILDIHFLVKEEMQRNVYRILQELLNNVGKHSRANNVSVKVAKVESFIKFSVTDDGVGFDVDEVHRASDERSMGLTTISERVRILGGVLTIDTAPGKGSVIEFTAPI